MGFDPNKDIPSLSGKTFVITGGTNGLGRQTILTLVKHDPEHILFTGRNTSAAQEIITSAKALSSSTKFTFVEADQLSLTSVASAAKEILVKTAKIDVLICNAGVMATAAALTKDGYENQFGVNHVAHALFVKLLLPALNKAVDTSGEARVLFLTSTGFNISFPGGVQFDSLKTTQDFGPGTQWARYGQSKLANVQYPAELARQHPSITFVSLHPGVVKTDLIGRLSPEEKELVYSVNKIIVEPEEGVWNTCWCATTAKNHLKNGELYLPVGQAGEHSKDSANKELQGKLWEWTRRELEAF